MEADEGEPPCSSVVTDSLADRETFYTTEDKDRH